MKIRTSMVAPYFYVELDWPDDLPPVHADPGQLAGRVGAQVDGWLLEVMAVEGRAITEVRVRPDPAKATTDDDDAYASGGPS